jgi:hypothetical protein
MPKLLVSASASDSRNLKILHRPSTSHCMLVASLFLHIFICKRFHIQQLLAHLATNQLGCSPSIQNALLQFAGLYHHVWSESLYHDHYLPSIGNQTLKYKIVKLNAAQCYKCNLKMKPKRTAHILGPKPFHYITHRWTYWFLHYIVIEKLKGHLAVTNFWHNAVIKSACVCVHVHLPPSSLGISRRLVGTSMAGLGSERFKDFRMHTASRSLYCADVGWTGDDSQTLTVFIFMEKWLTLTDTYNTGKHVGGNCSKSNGRSTILSLTETNQTVCVMLSVERVHGYDENKMLVSLNVFQTHMKITMLFSGHVQL